ncbi:hypothetical protein BGZ51_003891 [Haplosporangium sp. Z 767]|nr:hypothetical protein BGZ51_003891 [Haplosporangium sp. Z 767]KAF9187904.1 hypothetical protein BGZ50_001688 [Haplosporangium sp. Z 11]
MIRPAHPVHRRNSSYESNTPPPYVQSTGDAYSGHNGNGAPNTGRRMGKELAAIPDFEDDLNELLIQMEQIDDPEALKRLLIQKEQERQNLASNLDLAARLGLDLHQQMQRLEAESTAKLQSLQDENIALQSKANQSQELSYQLASSEHEVKELNEHNRFLQKELDTCRHELKAFRKELDELSEQMTEISTEMVDAKKKVNTYARRLGEVEQELALTRELNVNLQVQLDNALQKQKQAQSSASQTVKMIQSDLGKVFSDSDTMRMTLEELETRQMKCEGKVIEMMTNTREYAQLLEEAQETIHTLRIESDLEGRGWSRGPQAAIWDNKTGEGPEEQMEEGSTSKRKSTIRFAPNIDDMEHRQDQKSKVVELDPMFDSGAWDDGTMDANSLGQELGSLESEFARIPRGLDQEFANVGHGTLAEELEAVSDHPPSNNEQERTPQPTFASDTDSFDDSFTASQRQRVSLSAELHQLLEENNILQTILSKRSSRNVKGAKSTHGSSQQSSHSVRDIGKTLSMMTLANSKSASTSASTSTSAFASTSATAANFPPSPHPSPAPSTRSTLSDSLRSASSVSTSVPSGTGISFASGTGADVGNTSFTSTTSSTGGRRSVLDVQNTLGLKYLLSATSSADLSNVITKTNVRTPAIKHSSDGKPTIHFTWEVRI